MIVETLGRRGIDLVQGVLLAARENRRLSQQDPHLRRFNLIMLGAPATLLASALGLEYVLQCRPLADLAGNLAMVLSGASFLQHIGLSE